MSKSLQITNAAKDVEKKEPFYTVGGNANWWSHYGDLYGASFSCCSRGSQGKNTAVVCHSPPPGDHIFSELSTMTCPSWVALHGMAYSFIELDKAVVHVIRLVSILWLWFSVCLPSDGDEWLMEVSWWERLRGKWVLFWWVGPWSVNL